jgi:uncharacterized membrane protein YsdA (DUF1294 family)
MGPFPAPLHAPFATTQIHKVILPSKFSMRQDTTHPEIRLKWPYPFSPCRAGVYPIQSAHSQAKDGDQAAVIAQALPWIGAYYLLINAVTIVVWGLDKLAAMRHGWRTPERTLHRLIFAGGFGGGLAGMLLFRHKTRHPVFYWALAGALAAHCAGWSLLYLLTRG